MCVCVCELNCSVVSNSVTSGTIAFQVALSMEFSRQGYWRGLPFPTPRGSLQQRNWTSVSCVSYNGRQILYQLHHLESSVYLSIYLSIYIYVYIYSICVCVCIYILYMCVYIYIEYVCVCVYIYSIRVCVYI